MAKISIKALMEMSKEDQFHFVINKMKLCKTVAQNLMPPGKFSAADDVVNVISVFLRHYTDIESLTDDEKNQYHIQIQNWNFSSYLPADEQYGELANEITALGSMLIMNLTQSLPPEKNEQAIVDALELEQIPEFQRLKVAIVDFESNIKNSKVDHLIQIDFVNMLQKLIKNVDKQHPILLVKDLRRLSTLPVYQEALTTTDTKFQKVVQICLDLVEKCLGIDLKSQFKNVLDPTRQKALKKSVQALSKSDHADDPLRIGNEREDEPENTSDHPSMD